MSSLTDILRDNESRAKKPQQIRKQENLAVPEIQIPRAKAVAQKPAGGLVMSANQEPKQESKQEPKQESKQEPEQLTYMDMFRVLNPYTPPTPEQLDKERKEQKRKQTIAAISDGISSLANLYFTSQGAPNMYNPKESMSEKNRALWDKLNKERKEDAARYATGIMNAAKLDEERANGDRNYKLALEKDKKDDERWQKQFDANEKAQSEAAKLARDKFNYGKDKDKADNELAAKKMNEAIRQFNVSSQQTAQRIKQESSRIQKEIKKGQVTFVLGDGNGTVNVSTDAINDVNMGYVFSKLPEEVKTTVHGEPIFNKITGKIIDYNPPSTEAMLIAIGSNIQKYPDVQNALREIAGQKVKNKKGNGYNNTGTDKKDNRGY